MKNLNLELNSLKVLYREIFTKSADEILKRIDELKPQNAEELLKKYPNKSEGYIWQQNVIKMFDNDISKEIYRKWNEILEYRKMFKCSCCATCCNLACSEFSYEELQQKANNNDNFAKQFLSIFVPYKSKEEARKIYPEYIKMLEDNKETDVYFYHCPKLNKDKKCSDYENRPQICRDFPDNPLVLLPDSCGFKSWKDEIQPVTLMLHSMLEIIGYYKEQINSLYNK